MKVRLGTTRIRSLGLGVIALAVTALLTVAPQVAQAMPSPSSGAACLDTGTDTLPAARRIPDTPTVSSAVLQRVQSRLAATQDRMLADTSATGARTAATLPVYRVKVQIHVIHGRHKGERKIKQRGARRLFAILQGGYNGTQSTSSEPMGLVFDLKRITITTNDRWYHAGPMSRADKQMKRKLHRGTAATLNIYIKSFPKYAAGSLLGYSRFPWQYAHSAKLDGVEVNVIGLPGGRATGYNLGDTVVHETGHWLGLLHTFQGFCDLYNDGVKDTPAESGYAQSCTDVSNLCDANDVVPAPDGPGYFNPALNFMEYTPDACMRMFTEGQHVRVATMFRTYRFGR